MMKYDNAVIIAEVVLWIIVLLAVIGLATILNLIFRMW